MKQGEGKRPSTVAEPSDPEPSDLELKTETETETETHLEKDPALAATMLLSVLDEAENRPGHTTHLYQLDVSAPLPSSGLLVAHFGWRERTETRPKSFHTGIDFAVDKGTPVAAVQRGKIVKVIREQDHDEDAMGYGNCLVLRLTDQDAWLFYGHLEQVLVMEGMTVRAGQAIGTVGNSTNGRLPLMTDRLHFELRVPTADGLDPFPGPRRINSRDPVPWLKSIGVEFDELGRLRELSSREPGYAAREPDPRVVSGEWDFLTPTPTPIFDD